jgi:hypothetical protein
MQVRLRVNHAGSAAGDVVNLRRDEALRLLRLRIATPTGPEAAVKGPARNMSRPRAGGS